MDYHQPVLLDPLLHLLDVVPGHIYLDVTLGHGGHTIEILRRRGIVYGLDADPDSIKIATERIAKLGLSADFHPIPANYSSLKKLIGTAIPQDISALIADLGLNSFQQTSQGRGFSFNDNLSLDMRLNPKTQRLTAENIINTYSYSQLYEIFTKYAQEDLAKPLIQNIISQRQKQPITTGLRLSDIIRHVYTKYHRRPHHDPATKIFLALRITVNRELDQLSRLLSDSLTLLPHNCLVALISFHSGEDRLIKNFIRHQTLAGRISSSSRPIHPGTDDTRLNPLSRSATLRSFRIK